VATPDAAAGAATVGRLRLWHTAGVLATLPVATSSQPGFSFTNLLILAVAVAVLYPVQKKIREVASRRRRERWAREDREAEEQLRQRDRDDSDGSAGRGPDGL
jgi:hypothetical protein